MERPTTIQVSHPDVRWRLKQAAAERHLSVRVLVTAVLCQWLDEHGLNAKPTQDHPLETNAGRTT